MSKPQKTLDRVLSGTSDANTNFNDLRALLKHVGFEERIRGSHHTFTREDVPEILNLQPRGSQAKPYQVKQVRRILLAPRLVAADEEERPEAQSQEQRRPHPREGPPGEASADEGYPTQEGDQHD